MVDTMIFIDLLKVLYCIPFLLYSCYTDILARRVSNRVLKAMLAGSIIFVIYDIIISGIPAFVGLLFSVSVIFVFVYILFQFGGFGGADAKILIILAIIMPVYPTIELFGLVMPLSDVPTIYPFAFSVFVNSVLLTMVVPLLLFFYNLFTLKPSEIIKRPAYLFVGFKADISNLLGRHIKLIEEFYLSEGELHTKFRPGGASINEETVKELEGFAVDGLMNRRVWVTPGLPYIISITLGFFIAVLYGDLIFAIAKLL